MTTSTPLIREPGESGLSDYSVSWSTKSFSPLLGHRLLVKDVSSEEERAQWDYEPLCFVEAASNNMSAGITLYYIIQWHCSSLTLKQSFCCPRALMLMFSAGGPAPGWRRLEDTGHPNVLCPHPPRGAHHQVLLPPDQPDLQLLVLADDQVPQLPRLEQTLREGHI